MSPLPLLHGPGDARVSVHGLKPEGDEDERAIQGYARQHPQEDLDEDEEEQAQTSSSQQGGVVVEVSSAIQGQQAMEAEGEAQAARDKRAPGEVRLPIPGRQRVAEAEATKRGQQPEGIQKVKAAKLSSPGLIPTQRFESQVQSNREQLCTAQCTQVK